jgi:hypothetical protein
MQVSAAHTRSACEFSVHDARFDIADATEGEIIELSREDTRTSQPDE